MNLAIGMSAPVPMPTPNDRSPDCAELIDAKTAKRVPTRDMREKVDSISAGAGCDTEAERALVENKIDMTRSHPTLSEAEKSAVIAEREEKLNGSRRFLEDTRVFREGGR